MKKVFSYIIILALLLSFSGIAVFAAEMDFEIKALDSTTAEITKYTGSDSELTVPKEIDGYEIVSISEGAFSKNKNISSVTIPDTVTEIGKNAFAGSYVKTVKMGENLTTLGENAFFQCVYLEDITLSPSIKEIPNSCFYSCTRLENIEIPEGVEFIDDSAFWGCSHLVNISLPSSLISIGSYSFAENIKLEKLTLPENLGEIKSYAFFQCSALKELNLPNSTKRVGEFSFAECTALESLNLNEGLEWIGASAFDTCSVTSVKIPQTVKDLGDYSLGYYFDQDMFDYFKVEDFHIDCTENTPGFDYAVKNGFDYTASPLIPEFEVGDVNMDTTVNVKDATAIQKHMASILTFTDEAFSLADYNYDGEVNVKDATAIQKSVAGIS